jgi:fructokinase
VKADRPFDENLSLQITGRLGVVALGEVLWDVFPHSSRLGGAPLNFAAHARRLGHDVCLISAVGLDELGRQAAERIAALQIDTTFLQTTPAFPTGTAAVELIPGDKALFNIHRPAAYDAIRISDSDIENISRRAPGWLYYGTLFAVTHQGRTILKRLLNKLYETVKFYDLNLRPGCDSPALLNQLLEWADVVKVNEEELHRIHEYTNLPLSYEKFCREAAVRYGLKAVAVTLGGRGCAILVNGHYVEAVGHPVDVADPVGAGDAFAAAFMHGLSSNWAAAEIAAFANRVGALVASRDGAIPDWTLEEAVKQ